MFFSGFHYDLIIYTYFTHIAASIAVYWCRHILRHARNI